ncbi:helix-turn-helix domain-containing protein [Nocardia sp. KC 131]|uniref:helix-turn-helix domain-containing protein n=1 Tax=Nocardia arseniciresistens TaxID=3392119 RepID=UPI00398E31A5
MQVKWTGTEATALREALGLTQKRFAARAGIAKSTVTKWRHLGDAIELGDKCTGIMETMLARATPEQRARFITAVEANLTDDSSVDSVGAPWVPGIWTAESTVVADDLIREDLVLDRRQVGRALVGVVVGAHLLEPLERWLLSASEVTPARVTAVGVGLQEAIELENAARIFREWDDQFGGGLRRKAVIGQLSEVNDLLRDSHPPEIKRSLRRTLALLAETAATMSWDSGRQQKAQQYYMLAIRAARAADDPALCANAMAGMARQLLSLDHYGLAAQRESVERERATDALEVIRLAQDQFGDRVTPTVQAMLYTREAWVYGKLGRPTAFRRICDNAHEALSNSDASADPYWINYFDAAELAGTIGGRLLDMARRESAFALEAADHIEQAIQLRQPNRRRSSALDQLGMVEARFIEGEVEEACRIGQNALAVVGQTASDRVRKKLVKLYSRTEEFANVGVMAELRDRMRPLVATA